MNLMKQNEAVEVLGQPEDKKYTLYMHRNKVNNKVYIGITKQSLSRRFRHGEGYIHCPHFYAAIQKYGWENFETSIILTELSKDEAKNKEIEYIAKYKSNNSQYGYNISKGGNIICDGKEAAILNKKRWAQGVYDKIKNMVYCVETEQYYESALEAQRQTGIDNSSIQKACRGKIKYAGVSSEGQPLHWLFYEDVNEENIQNLKNRHEIIKGRKIPIYCPELDEHFSGTAEITEKYGFDSSAIRKAIKKQSYAYKDPITQNPLHWQEDWGYNNT